MKRYRNTEIQKCGWNRKKTSEIRYRIEEVKGQNNLLKTWNNLRRDGNVIKIE
jgi:hypothetical protein